MPTQNGPLLKLLDFGIAKLRSIAEMQPGLTRPGALMGTLEYMAPEQAFSADTVDHRADLFSVGIILFEMIAGSRPLEVDEPHVMAQRVMTGQIKRLSDLVPSVPPGLSDVVARALAGHPEQRFGSAGRNAWIDPALLHRFAPSGRSRGVSQHRRGYPTRATCASRNCFSVGSIHTCRWACTYAARYRSRRSRYHPDLAAR